MMRGKDRALASTNMRRDKLAYGVTCGTLRGFLPSGAGYTETLLRILTGLRANGMITESTDIRNAKRAEKLRPLKELSYRVGKKVNLIHSLYERNERMRERDQRVVKST